MPPTRSARPNLIVILIDDLRFDETGITGHPYMKTPHIDRLATEGALFQNAFHTTPLCSPNRASILTGQYASRHGIFDNVGRDALSHQLPNYHRELQRLGYETAHIGKRPVPGYVTDLLSERAVDFVDRARARPFALFLSHKAVHPDVQQQQDGTLDMSTMRGYLLPDRHRDLYQGAHYPLRPSVRSLAEVVADKPVWREVFARRDAHRANQTLASTMRGSAQEEIRKRAAMMASVDEGVGALLETLDRRALADDTLILFLGDNGFFFGEHGLEAERRFAYEEGIRTPFFIRFPRLIKPGTTVAPLALAIDIAPTMLELAGGTPGPHVQGHSLLPLLKGHPRRWRSSFLVEYFNESAFPWLVGMSYKAIRTERHKLIRWTHKDGVDELYDLEQDPYEMANAIGDPAHAETLKRLQRELRALVADAVGL